MSQARAKPWGMKKSPGETAIILPPMDPVGQSSEYHLIYGFLVNSANHPLSGRRNPRRNIRAVAIHRNNVNVDGMRDQVISSD